MVKALEVSYTDATNGFLAHTLPAPWRDNKGIAVLVHPEDTGDSDRARAIDQALNSAQCMREGDRVLIRAGPEALAMASQAAFQLKERGIESYVLLNVGRTELIADLMRSVNGGDIRSMRPSDLPGLIDSHQTITQRFLGSDRGHAIVPYSSPPGDQTSDVTDAVNLYDATCRNACDPWLPKLFGNKNLRSWAVWGSPTHQDVTAINQFTGGSWDLDELEHALVYNPMDVSYSTVENIALTDSSVTALIDASLGGGELHYHDEHGSDFYFRVTDSPIVLDAGRVGNCSLGDTTPKVERIINNPGAEVFGEVVPGSARGRLMFTLARGTKQQGLLQPPYALYVEDGMVTRVEAEPVTQQRLERLVGLRPLYTDTSKDDMNARRNVVEIGIGALNPAIRSLVTAGRIAPVTGNDVFDEKMGPGPHFGIGKGIDAYHVDLVLATVIGENAYLGPVTSSAYASA